MCMVCQVKFGLTFRLFILRHHAPIRNSRHAPIRNPIFLLGLGYLSLPVAVRHGNL